MRRWIALGVAGFLGLVVLVAVSPDADGLVLNGYFDDDDGNIFENDINAIAEAGITKGCNPPANTEFCPGLDVDRGAMAAFIRRALNLPDSATDYFTDDNNSIFENDINAIAEAGITKGCNPPANTRYCPNTDVDRGAMAAFIRRALNLPLAGADYFTDDNNSIFEADINAIAEAGITKGCNPPANTQYCPNNTVDRGAMAAFLRRALDLPDIVQQIPMGEHADLVCSKDGETCRITVDLSAGASYKVEEGWFQDLPATGSEMAEFEAGNTEFRLYLDGPEISVTEEPTYTTGGISFRTWTRTLSFTSGTHSLEGEWRWDGDTVLTTIVTVRASG